MENINPTLKCIWFFQYSLSTGVSIRESMKRYVQLYPSCKLSAKLRQFIFLFDNHQDWRLAISYRSSIYQVQFFELLMAGLKGQSILQQLKELQAEVKVASELELQKHLQILPFKMMAPMLMMQFPAFLIIFFGPLIQSLLKGMSL